MPTKSDRSVIRFGNGGFVITIPKAWAVFYEIQPGDKLTVITNDDIRILAPGQTSKESSQDRKEEGVSTEGTNGGE